MIMGYISLIIIIYLSLSSLYMFVFALAAKLPRPRNLKQSSRNNIYSVAVLIPAYKEDRVIINVAKKALLQNYPDFTVIVIADSLKPTTLKTLSQLPIKLIEVTFKKSTKAKALQLAMEQLPHFDTALILDADNIMEDDFLIKMNAEFNKGYEVIQGRRIAKNLNSNFAVLDAVSEAINNNIYNLGSIRLKLSSRLVGSGMFFDYLLLKKLIDGAEAIGGFDKELEIKLLMDNKYIHYLHNVLLWDEKVASGEVFKKQRTRWIAAQFFFLKRYGAIALKDLFFKGNIDLFNKIIQMALPPRLLIPVVLALGCVLHFFFIKSIFPLWVIAFVLNLIANLVSIPKKMYDKKLLNALFTIPKAVLMIFLGLFSLKKANKTFIHTPHDV